MDKLQQITEHDIQMEMCTLDLPTVGAESIEETMNEVIHYDPGRPEMQPKLWMFYPNRHNKVSARQKKLEMIEEM